MVAARIGSCAGERRSCGQSREPAPRVAARRHRDGRVLLRHVLSPARDGDEPRDPRRRRRATGRPPRACRVPTSSPSEPRAFRSGFWGTVPVRARDGRRTVELVARGAAGRRQRARRAARADRDHRARARARAARPARRRSSRSAWPPTTPTSTLFARPDRVAARADRSALAVPDQRRLLEPRALRGAHRGRSRATSASCVSRSERRLGFYRNFERALSMAPAGGASCSPCATRTTAGTRRSSRSCAHALGSAQLVYCDQRLVDADGRVLRETLWRGRRNNHTNLASLLSRTRSPAPRRSSAARWPSSRCRSRIRRACSSTTTGSGSSRWPRATSPTSTARSTTTSSTPGRSSARSAAGGARRGPRGLAARRPRRVLPRLPAARGPGRRRCSCAAPGSLSGPKRRALRALRGERALALAFAWLAARPLRALVGRNETLAARPSWCTGSSGAGSVAILAQAVARGPGACPATRASPTR